MLSNFIRDSALEPANAGASPSPVMMATFAQFSHDTFTD
jgi:hypothetical protein